LILLFTIGGRTGNQLFQIAYALSRRRTSEWLVSVGFGKTRSLLAGACRKRWLNIDAPFLRYVSERCIHPVLYRAFVRTGLVSSHYENYDTYTIRRGKIRFIRIMKGYFQSSERQAPDLSRLMRLKESLRNTVRPKLASIVDGGCPVFVHVRRSDYEGVIIGGQSARLPDRYYFAAVQRLRTRNPGLFFIIMGDDPEYSELLFKDLGPKYISRLTVDEDLALMSLCEGGVLSNSNFAWWGAFFSSSRLGYIAPRYWSGWRVKTWLPPELRGSFVTEYLDF